MKKIIVILAIMAVFTLGMVQPALAGKSMTKSYKVSVTLPELVGFAEQSEEITKNKVILDYSSRRLNIEETIIVRNNEEILLRTIVIN